MAVSALSGGVRSVRTSNIDPARPAGRFAAVWVAATVIATTAACSGSPAAPDTTASVASGSAVAAASTAGSSHVVTLSTTSATADLPVTFDLANGSFTISSAEGEISGQYTGQVSVSTTGRLRSDASLRLQITGGSGAFQGASGDLVGAGSGAFIDEGTFSLSLRGSVVTAANPKGVRVQGTVTGSTSLSCTIPLVATLHGDGAWPKLGDVHAVLSHAVVGAGCIS